MTDIRFADAIANPNLVAAFDPTTDRLVVAGLAAAQLQVTWTTDTVALTSPSGRVTLPISPRQVADGVNITFDDGSRLMIGDNITGASGDGLANALGGGTGSDQYHGLSGADTFGAGTGDNLVYGNRGNDVLAALAGNDSLYGGQESDVITDTGGANLVYGNLGADTLNIMGTGWDTVYGGQGDDLVYAGDGNDLIFAGRGNDTVSGQAGADHIFGFSGNDDLRGGGGANVIFGGEGDDRVNGGDAGDYLVDGPGADSLWGNDGADTLFSGLGDDLLSGGLGNDVLTSSTGRDTLHGGTGNDRIEGFVYNWSSGFWFNPHPIDANGGGGDDIVKGGGGGDTLTGEDGNDRLEGLAGNDLIRGGVGADTLIGHAGSDTLVGGDGNDVFDLRQIASTDMDVIMDYAVGDQILLGPNAYAGNISQNGTDVLIRLAGGPGVVFKNADLAVINAALGTSGGSGGGTVGDVSGADIAWTNQVAPQPAAEPDQIGISGHNDGTNGNANIAGLSGGGYVAIWSHTIQYQFETLRAELTTDWTRGIETVIVGQQLDATGHPTGPQFVVSQAAPDGEPLRHWNGSVTEVSGGGFAVTWVNGKYGPWDRSHVDSEIFVRVYGPDGRPLGDQMQVNSTGSTYEWHPEIADLADGGFVVTWQSQNSDGDLFGIFAQRYDASGNTLGNQFQVNATSAGDQFRPSVAGLDNGGFVIAWTTNAQDGDRYGIFAQRYDGAGQAIGGEFQVNTTSKYSQSHPSIAELADGGFMVVWNSQYDVPGNILNGMFAQRFDASGNPVDNEFRIPDPNLTYSPQIWYQPFPTVEGLADGGYVVSSWFGHYQRFDAAGNRVGTSQDTGYIDRTALHPVAGGVDGGYVVVSTDQVGEPTFYPGDPTPYYLDWGIVGEHGVGGAPALSAITLADDANLWL